MGFERHLLSETFVAQHTLELLWYQALQLQMRLHIAFVFVFPATVVRTVKIFGGISDSYYRISCNVTNHFKVIRESIQNELTETFC